MKRFWTEVALGEVPGAGQAVLLDGKPMRLPGSGAPLAMPRQALAEAIAAEWRDAGRSNSEDVGADQLPLTRLAATAQERISPDPEPTISAIAAYGETDLLCYRAERPPALVARQEELWQPWLDWAWRELGAPLEIATGITFVAQPPAALDALRRAVATHDPWALAGLGVAVPALGSLVLGLALAAGVLEAREAHDLARLDEAFEAEQWGSDAEAGRRSASVLVELEGVTRFIRLSRPT